MAILMAHGGCGDIPRSEQAARQAATERGLDAGWAAIGGGALEAVLAAVRQLEDEPILNAGIGATLNLDGDVELDAGVMEGTGLRAGGAGAVRDVRHPVDLARAVMDEGRHVLLVGEGASRFAREHGLEMTDPAVFLTDRQSRRWRHGSDTVGAVARDDHGRTAVAVSTGGVERKWPGRLGDSPVPGAGFYADDARGVACGTGQGEAFLRMALCHLAVDELGRGGEVEDVAHDVLDALRQRVGGTGGLLLIDAGGRSAAAHTTAFMAWARREG